MFGAAKSSLSEDAAVIKRVFSDMGIGRVETVAGAHGGIRYVPQMPANVRMLLVKELTEKMRDTSRILPGGYMYIADLFCTPYYVDGMGADHGGMVRGCEGGLHCDGRDQKASRSRWASRAF